MLNRSGKPRDVHAAILGYLQAHPKNAEFWMYEALAMAIEMNGGKPEDIHKALNYAADLAQRTHNPNHLVSVADKLFLKGFNDRVGDLLDEAAEKIPHRFEPLVMSINLAKKTHSPDRMTSSIDKLLSLGWPGQDDYFRREARKQAEDLADRLREETRTDEADAMLAALTESEIRDVYIRLSWDGVADYDLVVEEPLGATVAYSMPRSVFGGSLLMNGRGSRAEEIYVCPRAFDGDYIVRIMTIATDPAKPTTRLNLELITHEGSPKEERKTVSLAPNDPQAKPITLTVKGGRRTQVLPFVSPSAVQQSVEDAIKARSEKKQNEPASADDESDALEKSAKPRSTSPIR